METNENKTNENKTNEWSDREKGALWVRTKRTSSEKYLTGHIITDDNGIETRTKLVIFSNRKGKEKNEKAPDYIIYESVDDPAVTQAKESTAEDELL